jgi:hypothetical protein
MLTRMFASLTLCLYLAVGWVGVRVFLPKTTTLEISTAHLSLFSDYSVNKGETEVLESPKLVFQEVKVLAVRPTIAKRIHLIKERIIVRSNPLIFNYKEVLPHELPFNEPVTLAPVYRAEELSTNLLASYKDIKVEMVAEAPVVVDEVQTKMAASDSAPEFFEYPNETGKKAEPVKTEEDKTVNTEVVETKKIDSITSEAVHEEVELQDLIAFDYSKAENDLKEKTIPTMTMVTSQNDGSENATTLLDVGGDSIKKKEFQSLPKKDVNSQKNNLVSDFIKHPQFKNHVSIQIVGTDLKTTANEVGFEVRPQDDLSESHFDYNNGVINIQTDLSEPKMTRSVAILKRGFTPTNTEIILEEGASEVTIPLLNEETFNELIAPYEVRGPIGAVLVELDDETETATLDVPYSKVLKLNEKMQVVEGDHFSYQMFIGVKVGNALLSYRLNKGQTTAKIIHIHEREVTFESNFFEKVSSENLNLFEEDVLSKDKMPLITSAENIKLFASDKTSKKINDHSYRVSFDQIQLGSRKYLELNHLDEPIFVGYKDATSINVPSESFIRNILSKTEKAGMGNRCLIQVNLTRKATRVDVGTESAGESLRTYSQMLDSDGKFYDTLGPKSEKIIIVGENQENGPAVSDSKINLKITYEDNSIQYFGTYCSSNTYLVEQL